MVRDLIYPIQRGMHAFTGATDGRFSLRAGAGSGGFRLFLCAEWTPEVVQYVMNSPQKPSQPVTGKDSHSTEASRENDTLKPEDFPSGDEEDREGGNTGPEEKRQP